MEEVFELFPRLPMREQRAGRKPLRRRATDGRDRARPDGAGKLILLDEPFEGLAPTVVKEVMEASSSCAAGWPW